MKRLLTFLALCLPLYLFAQGFGSFSHDQPFFAKDSVSSTPSVPTNAMVAYYRFDEVTNGNSGYYYDSSVYAFYNRLDPQAFAGGYPTNQLGIVTNSVFLPGGSSTGEQLASDVANTMHTASNMTFTVWVYPTNCNVTAFIFAIINSGVEYEYSMNIALNKAQLSIGNSVGGQFNVTATSPTFITNGWNFIAGQIDAVNNRIRVRCATNSVMGAWFTNTWTGQKLNGNGHFLVGADNGIQGIRGRVDELTVWTNAISDEAITNIWNRVAPFN